ncbi:MAG: hypothetical protein A3G32_06675 [Deltaproteobacteria bacterium RIFCSPLOWO2_12_FULL_40_28]|nr:MAG: hypothetical protein A3C45_02770 [Deltaproteobacteria bacterium RIFCSPHIGHO2_02_FULL_40_28]OGQ19131.1 MAG: hypothetical protein A3E27_05860 [Deltaproteobacteria bacterium RIFCSPHIGHO2_12_FULL_40_32]OGQ40303.1 MAG: hypothetical protein A3I69_01300 [Deltaproteobacteria bacterium RIFCSPLOWO2_02_FULL_40_36]OGQ53574.1 MAG: hypothetical protein A3G32_06675 [Deltaproteobacteria bacterium RIFCSPLOWO2_12_FULL_40_28]
MIKKKINLLWLLIPIFLILSGACKDNPATSTEENSNLPESSIGINVGNPSLPKSVISFTTTTTEEAPDIYTNQNTKTTAAHCITFENAADKSYQMCVATPSNYNIGILEIDLINFDEASGVTNRAILYEGDQIDIKATSEGTSFTGILNSLPAENISYNAIQMVLAYLEQQTPTTAENPEQASRIMPAFQGVIYRWCTSPTELLESAAIQKQCGNVEAKNWDLLVDVDLDEVINFIDANPNDIKEKETRPANYNNFSLADNPLVPDEAHAYLNPDDAFETTTKDFYGVPGYFAPIIQFDPITLLASQAYSYAITIDITNMFRFLDKNPLYPGVYNPYYDGMPILIPKKINVTVSPLSE